MGKIQYNLPGMWWNKLNYRHPFFMLDDVNLLPKYASVYSHAKKIDISSGEMFPDFYNNSRFLENIEASAENGAEIKVLFGPALRVESDKFLKFAKRYDNVELFCRNKRETSHLKVIENIEGNMFAFLDGPHGLERQECGTLLLSDDFRSIILPLEYMLNGQLSKSQPVDKNHLIDRFASGRKVNGEYRGFLTEDENGKIVPATDEQIERFRLSYQA